MDSRQALVNACSWRKGLEFKSNLTRKDMDRESWLVVQEVLLKAVELDPAEQEHFVRKTLNNKPELIDEVLSLLNAPDKVNSEVKQHPIYHMLSTTEITPGMRIKQYVVDSELGRGGMGVVYKAMDTRLSRSVALKFLPLHLSQDDKARKRFEQEAKSASLLDHANICTIHDIDTLDDGRMFIAMAFYDGETLNDMIEGGPLPQDQLADIIIQSARGLDVAHQNKIIHRDIKPGNIMITRKGRVKILDFGIAKVSNLSLTHSGHVLGTMAYMSPERFRGSAVDHRTDIWSLGVVMYEGLTGKNFFNDERQEKIIYKIQQEEPDYTTLGKTSRKLVKILKRCLEKNPEDRYNDAGQLVIALEKLQGELPSKRIEVGRRKKPKTAATLKENKKASQQIDSTRKVPQASPLISPLALKIGVIAVLLVVIVALSSRFLFQGPSGAESSELTEIVEDAEPRTIPQHMFDELSDEVQAFLSTRNAVELEVLLNEYISRRVLRFAATPGEFDNPESSYILFRDATGIIALLGPVQNGARVDFVNRQWIDPPYADSFVGTDMIAFQ